MHKYFFWVPFCVFGLMNVPFIEFIEWLHCCKEFKSCFQGIYLVSTQGLLEVGASVHWPPPPIKDFGLLSFILTMYVCKYYRLQTENNLIFLICVLLYFCALREHIKKYAPPPRQKSSARAYFYPVENFF